LQVVIFFGYLGGAFFDKLVHEVLPWPVAMALIIVLLVGGVVGTVYVLGTLGGVGR
jgi:hypothetical protein